MSDEYPDQSVGVRLPLGIYRHYKGGLYTALCVVFHHESRQPMVVYVSHERGTVSVRPLFGHSGDPDGWDDTVGPFGQDEHGEPVGQRRFEFVGHHAGSEQSEVRLK